MSGAGFILAINLFVAGLFAVAFFFVGFNNRADRTAYWFSAAYAFVILYLSCEFIKGKLPWFEEEVGFLLQFNTLSLSNFPAFYPNSNRSTFSR